MNEKNPKHTQYVVCDQTPRGSVILKLKHMRDRRSKSVRNNNGMAMCFSTLSGLEVERVDNVYDRYRNGYICLNVIL